MKAESTTKQGNEVNTMKGIDINEDCKKDNAFSDDLKDGDSCFNCEFLTADNVGIIGGMIGMSAGTRKRCEKGYWKEDV